MFNVYHVQFVRFKRLNNLVPRSQWNKKEECKCTLAGNESDKQEEIEHARDVRPRDIR